MLTPVKNVQVAVRGFDRLSHFREHRVRSLVPQGFPRYARIFHPAWQYLPGRRVPLSWSGMANYTGADAHSLMQWENISVPIMRGAEVRRPDEGTIPLVVSQPLRDVLSRHSGRDSCWLGIWRGFGWDYRKCVPVTASAGTSAREWDLFRAPLSMMDLRFFVGQNQTANLIWAADLSWWVTTDIDLNSTYIGGDGPLIEAILHSTALEAWPAGPEDDVTIFSDVVNKPANGPRTPAARPRNCG